MGFLRHHRIATVRFAALVGLCVSLSACGGAEAPLADITAAKVRLETISTQTDLWRDSTTITEAHAAAESVLNLVIGPNVDGYGTVAGGTSVGLLPGQQGEASLGLRLRGCAGSALLGGSWEDPATRWAVLRKAIDEWTPTNNPFPSLPSEAQRVVGWATLTLRSSDLERAHEYAGHARLHVDGTREAVDECR